MKLGPIAAGSILLTAAVARGAAEPCAFHDEPHIVVGAGSGMSPELAARVMIQLKAGLETRRISVCPTERAPAHAPLARVSLEAGAGERVVITIEVTDHITDKRLARDVDLSNIPDDARPLVLALSIDEALRASWAELVLTDAPKPRKPVPTVVETAIRESVDPASTVAQGPTRWFLGAAVVGEGYAAGQRQLGVDARAAHRFFGERLFVHALVGARVAQETRSENGAIRARAFALGAGPGLGLTDPRASIGTDALLRLELTRVSYSADGDFGAHAHSGSATALYAEGGLAAWIAPAPALRVMLEVTAGVPLRSANALDDGEIATGLDGGSLALALAFGGML